MTNKHDQRKWDLTLLKQGIIVGTFITAVIFGPDIRGSISGASAASERATVTDRVLTLEMQNEEHTRLAGQIANQSEIMSGLQQTQAKLVVQVKILAEVISAMQDREFMRLEAGKK